MEGLPLGNVGQQMVYRIDWFKEAGYDKFPGYLGRIAGGRDQAEGEGAPVRLRVRLRLRRQPRLDVPAALVVRRREVDKDGKTVILDSAETAKSVDSPGRSSRRPNFQDVLGWTDVNNNRAFLAEQISCTNNATSILPAAKKEFPDSWT